LPKNTLTALAILLPLLVLMTFSSEGAAQDPYRNNVTDKIEPACYDQQLLIQHFQIRIGLRNFGKNINPTHSFLKSVVIHKIVGRNDQTLATLEFQVVLEAPTR
jgi:hypothetical protein